MWLIQEITNYNKLQVLFYVSYYLGVISAVTYLSVQHLKLKSQKLQCVTVSCAMTSINFAIRVLFSLIFELREQLSRIVDSTDFW